jgi:hypothetical protein
MNRRCAFVMIALFHSAWIAGLTAQSRQQDLSWVAPDRAASKPNPLAGRSTSCRNRWAINPCLESAVWPTEIP